MANDDGMRCEVITDDSGEVIAVARVSPDLSETGRAALMELIAAARRQFEADMAADPTIAERQAAAMARIRERSRRLRGGDGRG